MGEQWSNKLPRKKNDNVFFIFVNNVFQLHICTSNLFTSFLNKKQFIFFAQTHDGIDKSISIPDGRHSQIAVRWKFRRLCLYTSKPQTTTKKRRNREMQCYIARRTNTAGCRLRLVFGGSCGCGHGCAAAPPPLTSHCTTPERRSDDTKQNCVLSYLNTRRVACPNELFRFLID